MKSKVALLAGASGLVGSHLLTRLLDNPEYRQVYVVARSPLAIGHPRLTVCTLDFGSLADWRAPEEVDDVFCTLGTTIRKAGTRAAFRRVDHDYVVALGRAGLASGARCMVVVSALGASPRSLSAYSRVKGQTEEALVALGYPSLVLVRPSLLTGERLEKRPMEDVGARVMACIGPAFKGPLRRYRDVPASGVAQAMAEAARTPVAGVTIIQSEEIPRR